MNRISYGHIRKYIVILFALAAIVFAVSEKATAPSPSPPEAAFEVAALSPAEPLAEISGSFRRGESLYDVFKKNGLNMAELSAITESAAPVLDLGKILAGRPYSILVDAFNSVRSMTYAIDDLSVLSLSRSERGFDAELHRTKYERRTAVVRGEVRENLVNAIEDLRLAISLADIFAWDIDFTTDLRRGDAFGFVVEELWLGGEFKGYGEILSAEFVNNGHTFKAYLFEQDGESGYFDEDGNSLRRAFLKAPLSYRRISSNFNKRRYHPVLKTYRPHLGVDYAAQSGTPVLSVGDGTVHFAGYNGQNGRMVVIRHPGGYRTYYGHLSRIKKGLRSGSKVKQGDVIGYVGSTGLATGPHLDYRIKLNGRFINPLTLRMPSGRRVRDSLVGGFSALREEMDAILSAERAGAAGTDKDGERG